MMEFNQVVNKRQSCRKFSDKKVENEKLEIILQQASSAPSACNSQPWKFVVVNNETLVSKMPEALQVGNINKFTSQVNTFIVICESKAVLMAGATCDSQYYAQMDIGIATAFLTLSAKNQGLDTCIMGAFKDAEVKQLLSIPEDVKIKLILAVGYAQDDTTRTKVRKSLEKTCSFNQW